jgi:hypothetical protein
LRTESFTICPAPEEKEKKRTSQSDFQNKKLLKINSRIKLSTKKQLWKINPLDKKSHHFEVMMESLR